MSDRSLYIHLGPNGPRKQRNDGTVAVARPTQSSADLDCAISVSSCMKTMSIKRRYLMLKWLLILPFLGLLWVPFYNLREPMLFGFPFFYWYQLAWVPVTSLLLYLVYRSVPHDE